MAVGTTFDAAAVAGLFVDYQDGGTLYGRPGGIESNALESRTTGLGLREKEGGEESQKCGKEQTTKGDT